MLKGNVEIGENLPLGHQRDDLVDMWIGIDVVQPHPDAELAECRRQVDEFRTHLFVAPLACRVFDVEPVGRRIL